LAGARGGGASGRGRDRAAAELELTGAVIWAARVWESEIGRVCEPQWVAAVLLEHWIAGGRRRRRLTTAGRSCGGAPARSSAREEGMGVCECKSESMGSSGTCFKSRRRHGERELLLASQRARGARGDGGATWRGEERASAGRVSGGRGVGGHVVRRRAARGSWGSGKWPAKAAASRARGRAGGTRGRRRRTGLEFLKNAGTSL
jgi:hypothetical protein